MNIRIFQTIQTLLCFDHAHVWASGCHCVTNDWLHWPLRAKTETMEGCPNFRVTL